MMVGRDAASASRDQIKTAHNHVVRTRLLCIGGLFLLVVAGILADLVTGPAGLTLSDIAHGLFGAVKGDETLSVIMWQVRVPTALLAVLIGASLSLAGAEMQTILANPLASPFTLGVSSAAAFGAALAIVMGITIPLVPANFAVPVNAFAMAFMAVMVIQAFAALQQGSASLVLFGISLVFGFNALIAVLQFIAPADSLQQLVFWTMGSLGNADGTSVATIAVALGLISPFSLSAAASLTLLSLGEERAASLGVNLVRLRFGCLLRASLLAAISVAFAGTIGFIGLVGPHIARLIVGEDHRFFLPAAILSGAAVMSFASIASKVIIPGVLLPIGIVTSLIGLPFFLGLLLIGRASR